MRLPDRNAGAVAFYDPDELARRVGPTAERHLWQVLHAHRIAPMHDARRPEDVSRQRAALDGSLYEPAQGYLGPARGVGDGVLTLGAHGGLGDPDPGKLWALARAAASIHARNEILVYADDEDCASPRGADWRTLTRSSRDPAVLRVRVGWTCSEDPEAQPVDVPMVEAVAYSAREARAAARHGKEVWIYDGVEPRTGDFLIDDDAVSPRTNGWIAEMFQVPRWFYWESTYWYGRHGEGPVDPFADPESFHATSGDWANGDGVLVYPGSQKDAFGEHSLGFEGVLPSIRLKNWRRGLEDAGYLRLAREKDRARADAIARALVPAALEEARDGERPPWSGRGEAFYEARRELLALVSGPGVRGRSPGEDPAPARSVPLLVRGSLLRARRGGEAAAAVAEAGMLVAGAGALGAAVLVALAAVLARRCDQRSRSAIASRSRAIP
jgi:hypothetical protein